MDKKVDYFTLIRIKNERIDVYNFAVKQGKSGSYPYNNPDTLPTLWIRGCFDPSLYEIGTPIIHSKTSLLMVCFCL